MNSVCCGLISGFVGAAVRRLARATKLRTRFLGRVVDVIIGFGTPTFEGVEQTCTRGVSLAP